MTPRPDEYHIELADPRLRLIIRRRPDDSLDLRLARCSPNEDPRLPGTFHLTRAGFHIGRAQAIELRAALRELGGL